MKKILLHTGAAAASFSFGITTPIFPLVYAPALLLAGAGELSMVFNLVLSLLCALAAGLTFFFYWRARRFTDKQISPYALTALLAFLAGCLVICLFIIPMLDNSTGIVTGY